MTYRDIVPETNAVCKKHPKCYVDIYHNADNGCPYFDICQAHPDGSWAFETGFPFQNTYIIVLAESEKAAVEKFREKYPDRHTGTVNCAFWYSEEHWTGTPNEREYTEPAEVIA